MRPKLTEKQKKVMGFLTSSLGQSGEAPSLREMGKSLAISHAAVAQTLKLLETKGYIRRLGRYSRNIVILEETGVTDADHRKKIVPIVGRITAGLPIYATQEWDGSLVVDDTLYPGDNLFALKIQGQSMKDAGILDRDIAICRPRQYAVDREIVVALINGEEATVKRFFLHADHIELRPENSAFSPQTYGFDDIMIQGKVIGIIRSAQVMEGE
ncbi:repressor LexA [Desulfobacter hydrogenophilus]|uniref:LexA repressor n=1 Tax=Desulfobacter hydrogenophilus TaxID=2291 RepID=A0A328FG76_9BACT|nr:transcriptional repressor LexA [Desulfobacter hydrogenophilus]NDY71947.1 transcriptional repressor LexA [Desulfobacter hydrogenophilus]QBH12361.1 transcriptional repressor LexA [Desulfobacter hydrogenophilus]RAM02037.1 repressor LexA [Desulfobacter hydrogenophilus]